MRTRICVALSKGFAQKAAAAEPDSEILLKQLEAKPELMDAFTKKFVEQYGEQIMNQLAKKLIGA